MVYPPLSVRPSVRTLFPDNSSYSCHRIALRFGGQLNHEVVHRILFREVTVHQILIELLHFLKIFFRFDFVSG